jgi:hypothetical protein
MDVNWAEQVTEQLDWHWTAQLRPRLDGLTDDEYFWEPVTGCWNVRRRGEDGPATSVGQGDYTMDLAWPPPDPAPVTTIAWRLAHVIVGCFGARAASHFGGPPIDWDTFGYAGTAQEALAQLDQTYGRWIAGVRGLGADGMARPCGPAEGPFADSPLGAVVLHINRETIHHGAEIALLRDLYRHQDGWVSRRRAQSPDGRDS